jgi:hypothetical protein
VEEMNEWLSEKKREEEIEKARLTRKRNSNLMVKNDGSF